MFNRLIFCMCLILLKIFRFLIHKNGKDLSIFLFVTRTSTSLSMKFWKSIFWQTVSQRFGRIRWKTIYRNWSSLQTVSLWLSSPRALCWIISTRYSFSICMVSCGGFLSFSHILCYHYVISQTHAKMQLIYRCKRENEMDLTKISDWKCANGFLHQVIRLNMS